MCFLERACSKFKVLNLVYHIFLQLDCLCHVHSLLPLIHLDSCLSFLFWGVFSVSSPCLLRVSPSLWCYVLSEVFHCKTLMPLTCGLVKMFQILTTASTFKAQQTPCFIPDWHPCLRHHCLCRKSACQSCSWQWSCSFCCKCRTDAGLSGSFMSFGGGWWGCLDLRNETNCYS